MHDYSIDTDIRRWVHVVLAVVSLSLPAAFSGLLAKIGLPGAVTFPLSFGATFGIFYLLWDLWGWKWKWAHALHGIPNLNGKWLGRGKSNYKDPETNEPTEYEIEVIIRQTFSRLEVFTQTKSSTSRSMMASMELRRAMPMFRYGYENTPNNMANDELQRHPGMMDLRFSEGEKLDGDYFSGKHRLRFGELHLTKT